MRAVATKCNKTFVKELVAALSNHELQDRFDKVAEKKLDELLMIVWFMSSIRFLY